MNTRCLLCYFLAVIVVAVPTVNAGQHRRNNNRIASMPVRTGGTRTFVARNRISAWNGQQWNRQHWIGRSWNAPRWNNWNWHHHRRSFVFVDVGFPFWGWGYPYYYDYPPYGYSPYGYYGGGYYGGSAYNYGNQYGYDSNNNGYTNGSNVAELQRKLADAGYYRGPIDGIMGSRTYYALKAYRHDHANGNENGNGYHQYPTQRSQPYSPPPVTTEPSPNE